MLSLLHGNTVSYGIIPTATEQFDGLSSLMQLSALLSSCSKNQLATFLRNIIYDETFHAISLQNIIFSGIVKSYQDNQISSNICKKLVDSFPLNTTLKSNITSRESMNKEIIAPKHILQIPSVLLCHITEFLNYQNLLCITKSCKDFFYISRNPNNFYHITMKENEMNNIRKIIPFSFSYLKSLEIEYDDFIWNKNWSNSLLHLNITCTDKISPPYPGQMITIRSTKSLYHQNTFFKRLSKPYLQSIRSFKAPFFLGRIHLWSKKINKYSLIQLEIKDFDICIPAAIRLLRNFINLQSITLLNIQCDDERVIERIHDDIDHHIVYDWMNTDKSSFQQLEYVKISGFLDEEAMTNADCEYYIDVINWMINNGDRKKEAYLSLPWISENSSKLLDIRNIEKMTLSLDFYMEYSAPFIHPLESLKRSMTHYDHTFDTLIIMKYKGDKSLKKYIKKMKQYQDNIQIKLIEGD